MIKVCKVSSDSELAPCNKPEFFFVSFIQSGSDLAKIGPAEVKDAVDSMFLDFANSKKQICDYFVLEKKIVST